MCPQRSKDPVFVPFLYDARLLEDPSAAGGSTQALQIERSWLVVIFLLFEDAPPIPVILMQHLRREDSLVQLQSLLGAPIEGITNGLLPVQVQAFSTQASSMPALQRRVQEWWEYQKAVGAWPPESEE